MITTDPKGADEPLITCGILEEVGELGGGYRSARAGGRQTLRGDYSLMNSPNRAVNVAVQSVRNFLSRGTLHASFRYCLSR